VNRTLVWRQWRFPCARAVVRRRWRREEEASVAAVPEETGSSGINGGGGDRRSGERRGLKEFWDEKRNDTRWVTICRLEHIGNGSELELLRIGFESIQQSFEIRTTADKLNTYQQCFKS
jgi:hypothetical protein